MQGSSSSASFLQQALLNCLVECLSYVFILWDDIIVVANDEQTMLERLAIVFQCLQNSGFVVRRHKVSLYVGATCSEIELFGLQVDLKLKTVRPLRNKIDALLARPIPANISALRSYLGSVNWHHHFIKGAGQHYGILHRMTHKNSQFVYTEERMIALEYFLDQLTSPECFTHLPRPDLEFFIFTDASEFSAGFTLLQCEPEPVIEADPLVCEAAGAPHHGQIAQDGGSLAGAPPHHGQVAQDGGARHHQWPLMLSGRRLCAYYQGNLE